MYRFINFSTRIFVLALVCSVIVHTAAAENEHIIQVPGDDQSVAMTSWLVTGPFASPYIEGGPRNGAERVGYDYDYLKALGGEAKARISPGATVRSPEGKTFRFALHQFQQPYVDLNAHFGENPMSCAYLYAEIQSPEERIVHFHVGTNDAGKVWVGGETIVQYPGDRAAARSQHMQQVTLKAGQTPVLVKVDQAGGGWGAYVDVYGDAAHKAFLAERKANEKGRDLDDPECIATHIETKVICKQVGRYIGWPTITKTRSGELIAVFSGNRDAHVCPYGVTQMLRSHDNGKTWSEPVIINNTPLDDRDAGILQTQSGTLLVSWFTSLAFDTPHFYAAYPQWKRHTEKLGVETKTHWLGNWTRRSLDNGITWEEPVKQQVSAPHGPIELADGRLLYVGTATLEAGKALAVEASRNDGQSWQLIATIPIPEDESIQHYHEPHVVEIQGKLVSLFRYEPVDHALSYLRQSESTDGGHTWTMARKIPIWGFPPHLTVLENGWLLVSYGVRRPAYSERACISRDGGVTWDSDHEIILSRAMNNDLGYPASVQLDDGSILTIYYQIDKPGEKTCLMSTHWRLK